jgi:hypothetical protein
LTDQLARIDWLFLRLNLLLLVVVVLLPFPTRLMGSALDAYARYEHLYSPAGEDEELQTTQRKFLPVVTGYAGRFQDRSQQHFSHNARSASWLGRPGRSFGHEVWTDDVSRSARPRRLPPGSR